MLQIKCDKKSLLSIMFHAEQPISDGHFAKTNLLVHNWLDSYFSGESEESYFSINPDGTSFQKSVWDLLLSIPFGKTESYKELSQRYGNLKAIRAVATANGANPIPIIIPCHRVIGSDGSLVGFSGGLDRKKWLLQHEARYASGVRELFE
jgi:methylated-DNA-[protein]-cysteine S-methyltransferase